MSVPVMTYTSNGGQYAKLDLNQYMIQYLENRYIDVHIEFNHAQGLKIPNSSIIKRNAMYSRRSIYQMDQTMITALII